MKENLKDILSHLNPDISQETLLLYLQGKLSPEEQHKVEKQLLEDDFESEALEGLQNFNDQQKIQLVVEQLNKDLRIRTENKKKLRKKRELHLDPTILIAVVIILLLLVLAFFVVMKVNGS